MLEAVRTWPSMVTPGRPTPTGVFGPRPADVASRLTSRWIEAMIASGVEGTGVGTRNRSERSMPLSTSTTAAFMPLPPTSTPIAIRPSATSALLARSS